MDAITSLVKCPVCLIGCRKYFLIAYDDCNVSAVGVDFKMLYKVASDRNSTLLKLLDFCDVESPTGYVTLRQYLCDSVTHSGSLVRAQT